MKRILVLLGIFTLGAGALQAQFIEDGLRTVTPNAYYSPRQGALGLSFIGVGDDASALFMNPALLTFSNSQEFNVGFTMNRRNTTNIGGEPLTGVNNYASNDFLSNVAFVAPAGRKLSVGIGYSSQSVFENDLEWTNPNSQSTYIAWRAAKDKDFELNSNMMKYLGLANSTSYTPLVKDLSQNDMIQERGGIDVINAGLSYDFNPNLAGGVSVAFKFGSYDFTRKYTETDVNNIYNFNDVEGFTNIDFTRFNLTQTIEQDIFGLGLTLGVAGRAGEDFRWSLAVELPTSYNITENGVELADVNFDNGDNTTDPWDDRTINDYTISSPFVYSGGASYHIEGITFSAGLSYTDLRQMEMDDVTDDNSLNNEIRRQLKDVLTYSFGAEYEIPGFPAYVRAGYEKRSSPWASESVDGARTTLSAGIGFVVGKNIRVDGVWRTFKSQEQLSAYGFEVGSPDNNGVVPLINQFENTFSQVGLGLTWRFTD